MKFGGYQIKVTAQQANELIAKGLLCHSEEEGIHVHPEKLPELVALGYAVPVDVETVKKIVSEKIDEGVTAEIERLQKAEMTGEMK